ncbi:MAG: family 16 glycosylhydrolase [Pseudomonadota bacterium]
MRFETPLLIVVGFALSAGVGALIRPHKTAYAAAPPPLAVEPFDPLPPVIDPEPPTDRQLEKPWREEDVIRAGEAFIWRPSDGLDMWLPSTYSVGEDHPYAVSFKTDNVRIRGDELQLIFNPRDMTGGEIQSHEVFGHGTYTSIFRPSKGKGTVSAFFAYAHKWQGLDTHNEIDFEWFGSRPNEVELNWFRDGQSAAPFHGIVEVDRDMTDGFARYTFVWTPTSIIWLKNGQKIFETRDHLPRGPLGVFASQWTGKERIQSWHGELDVKREVAADVRCISFVPLGETGPSC